jgi:hypothetical protein
MQQLAIGQLAALDQLNFNHTLLMVLGLSIPNP